MKKGTHRFLEVLRFACLTTIILLGFITIIGTSGDDEKTSGSDTRERGVYKFVVTKSDGGEFEYYVNTRKLDMEKDAALVEEKTEHFDADDNIRKEVTDDDGDGEPDFENEFDYTDGNLEEGRYGYYDGDQILQISNVIIYTYYNGEQGDNLWTQELDNDYDGTFEADAAYQYTYVEHGDKWDLDKTTYDSDGDTETNYTYTYDYDYDAVNEQWNLTTAGYWLGDIDLDNQISEVSYIYDDDGNLHMSKTDFDLSGEIDWTYVFTYDGDGNKISDEAYWGDGDTGDLISGIYYTYESGDLVKEESDENGNGKIDSVIYREYDDGDPEGRITKEETDYNNDDEIDLTYTWEYIDN
jgi:hypothetical protein